MQNFEMDEKQLAYGEYSDIFKDVYGVRPHWTRERYEAATLEEILELTDQLAKTEPWY